jgi:hypothetical protein
MEELRLPVRLKDLSEIFDVEGYDCPEGSPTLMRNVNS